MKNFETLLNKYAQLAVHVGVNLQKNQILVINSPIECANFVRLVAKYAYEAGAKDVHVEWSDEQLTLMRFLNADDSVFSQFPKWKADAFEQFAENNAAFLSISASNPELLKSVDQQRIANFNKARGIALKKYRQYIMNSIVSWSIVSIPTKDWAKKVFPKLDDEKALEKLWEAIFNVVRINEEDPIKAWNDHINNLTKKVNYLNKMKFKSLHLTSSETDLVVELPKGHVWAGGGELNAKNIYFIANMPTEEVFTMPLKTGVNGTVKNTKPLNYSGNLIDNFKLTFKNGKVVDFEAEKGYETLKKLIETDEGASYLGEIALVPHDSPISNSNITFYNTLFDENASCHLALGMAYPMCIENGSKMSKEELEKAGANYSLIHNDFMIGSKDLDIIAEKENGEKIQIFKNGNWAI